MVNVQLAFYMPAKEISSKSIFLHFTPSLDWRQFDDGCGLAQLLCLLWRKEVSWILE